MFWKRMELQLSEASEISSMMQLRLLSIAFRHVVLKEQGMNLVLVIPITHPITID